MSAVHFEQISAQRFPSTQSRAPARSHSSTRRWRMEGARSRRAQPDVCGQSNSALAHHRVSSCDKPTTCNPIHDTVWMSTGCTECGTPNVIGCPHQSDCGDSEDEDTDADYLTVVAENRSTLNDRPEILLALETTPCWIQMALTFEDRVVMVPLAAGSTYATLTEIISVACSVPDSWAMDISLDLYLPAASSWFTIEDCQLKLATLSLEAFLDHGVLRARTRWRVRGGAKKKQPKKTPKPKKRDGNGNRGQNLARRPANPVSNPTGRKVSGGGSIRAMRANSNLAMAKCTADWLIACAKPFGARFPCIPNQAIPSLKSTGFLRLYPETGTNNVGWVGINPSWLADINVVLYTGNTYAGLTMAVLNNAGTALALGVNAAPIANLPYRSSDMSSLDETQPYLQGRVVSCGMRSTYAGTLLNLSGVQTCYSSPNHGNAIIECTAPTSVGGAGWGVNASSVATAVVEGITQKPCSLQCYPVNDAECMYPAQHFEKWDTLSTTHTTEVFCPFTVSTEFDLPQINANAATKLNATTTAASPFNTYHVPPPVMFCFYKTSAAATFLVEIVVHVEYIGPKVAAMSTQNVADPQGLQIAQSILQRLPEVKQAKPGMDVMQALKVATMEVASALKPIAISAITKGLTGLLI